MRVAVPSGSSDDEIDNRSRRVGVITSRLSR
jgi:hypothetical protein